MRDSFQLTLKERAPLARGVKRKRAGRYATVYNSRISFYERAKTIAARLYDRTAKSYGFITLLLPYASPKTPRRARSVLPIGRTALA